MCAKPLYRLHVFRVPERHHVNVDCTYKDHAHPDVAERLLGSGKSWATGKAKCRGVPRTRLVSWPQHLLDSFPSVLYIRLHGRYFRRPGSTLIRMAACHRIPAGSDDWLGTGQGPVAVRRRPPTQSIAHDHYRCIEQSGPTISALSCCKLVPSASLLPGPGNFVRH